MTGFTGGWLDRADRIRHDQAALTAAFSDPRARLLRLDALDPQLDADGRLVWGALTDAPDDADFLFLGFRGQVPHFAALITGTSPPAGRSPALFQMLGLMPDAEAATYACARSLVDWHLRHGFCANCGHATTIFRAGWARRCGHCGAEHFPRTDPVVIMLAERGDRVVLGRQPVWPAGRYSALAGFVEVGESIEEAVARETLEEVGIAVTDIRYVASQPWPFASSLMIAAIGTAQSDDIAIDPHELEDAQWFSRADVQAALAGAPAAPFIAPPRYAIAHTLLGHWAAQG